MSDFSRYMIVTDLDGTFLSRESTVVERNMRALRGFLAHGGLFTVATGRVHINIRSAFEPSLYLSAPAVLCNGAYLYDFSTDTAMFEQLLSARDAADILHFVKSRFPDMLFRVSALDSLRIEAVKGLLEHDVPKYDEGSVKVCAAESWSLDDWFKITFREEREVLDEFRAAFVAHFGDRFAVNDSATRIFEAQAPQCSKAAGLNKLRKLASIDGDITVIACGDFENDIQMLRAADYAVAPANAHPSVKAIADRVMCDCDQGLIADVIAAIEMGQFPLKG